MVHSAEALAAWAVSVAVVASVTWLALHGWRQGRRLRRWATDRGLDVQRRDDGRTDDRLEPFRRDDEHLVREIGSVREVVELGDGVRVFRCEERLDLTPWSSGSGPPRTRVAVTFPASGEEETYSVFDEDGRPTRDRAPGLRFSVPSAARKLAARMPDPPHPLSVTLTGGRGLAYLLTPSGAVSPGGLDYLARLGRRLAAGTAGASGSTVEEDDRRGTGGSRAPTPRRPDGGGRALVPGGMSRAG